MSSVTLAFILDLSCSVIGKLWSIAWYHGSEEIVSKTGRLRNARMRDYYYLLQFYSGIQVYAIMARILESVSMKIN